MSSQIRSDTTTVDVGTLPSGFQNWDSAIVNFHGFEDLSSVRGEEIKSPKFTCVGNRWRLSIYPGGEERSDDGNVAVALHNIIAESIKLRYRFILRDSADKPIVRFSSKEVRFDPYRRCERNRAWIASNFARRSTITDALVKGTLTIEVRMMRIGPAKSSSLAFVPENPLCRNILNKFMDEESADIIFEVEHKSDQGGNPSKKARISPTMFYVHRLILQDGAPILAQFCKPGRDPCQVSITDVGPDIFQQALYYVYGGKLSDKSLRSHAKDFIDAADKYGIVSLKLKAEAYYVESTKLDIDNIVDNLLYAESKNCALLKEAVMDFIVKNGDDIMGKVSFDNVPGSVVTDLLAAMGRSKRKDDDSSDASGGFNTMRVADLRRMLSEKGLDVDGSREAMIALLKENS
mmetsp:Transcript_21709/g.47224  ORF Transcript_21709/g.47224 Transcript_21709/m.47224 type:complete len:405 (+) Transcript_21709:47-1261(+)